MRVKEQEKCSWNRARELCYTERVYVNGFVVSDPTAWINPKDGVEVKATAQKRRKGTLHPKDILFEDDQVILINKRPQTITVRFEETDRDSLEDQIRAYLRRQTKKQGPTRDPFLGVVQRLDKDTTGVLVFAKTMHAKKHLEEQIRGHTAYREYVAWIHGHLKKKQTIESFIMDDRGDGLRGSWFRPGDPPRSAKWSHTDVSPIMLAKTSEGFPVTQVRCTIKTGRQHQIRIHLSEAGHPLVGERVYVRGMDQETRGQAIAMQAPRCMLHARVLELVHPREKPVMSEQGLFSNTVRWDSPLPDDFMFFQSTLSV